MSDNYFSYHTFLYFLKPLLQFFGNQKKSFKKKNLRKTTIAQKSIFVDLKVAVVNISMCWSHLEVLS